MPPPSPYVRDLYVYPLKSGAGMRVPALELDALGAAGDRRWMVVDAAGRFLSQRECARMALLQPAPTRDGLSVSFPDMPALQLTRPGTDGARRMVTVWHDTVEAVDAGPDAARWMRRALGRDCAVVHCPPDFDRLVDRDYASGDERVGFADGFPLLVVGKASLDDLNAKLEARREAAVPMNRFRPNIVIDGATAFAEDTWRRIFIGDGADAIALDIVKPCARCSIVPVDQATGVRGVEPLRTLTAYRRRGTNVLFGQNALHRALGTINEGAPVRIAESARS